MKEFDHRSPIGWRRFPLWSLFRRTKRTGYEAEELLSVYRDHGVVPKASRDDNFNKESQDLSTYQLVEVGDLVTNKMKAWQGSISISTYKGIVSPAYYVYRPLSGECGQFLHYLLRSKPYISLYQRISKGVRINQWDLEHAELRRVPVLLPDPTMQKTIAAFLDAETTRIDALINKKQRLISTLGEKQSVEVDRIVLGCLDQHGRPALDESSREIWKLKALCSRLGNGFVGPTRDILVDEGHPSAVPYLQSTHVKGRRIDFHRKPYYVTKKWIEEKLKARVQEDDLLIVQTGDCGATAIVGEEFAGSGCHAMIITRPIRSRVLPALLLHILSSNYGRSQLAAIQTGALHPHLEVGFVKELPIPLPPREAQSAVLSEIVQTLSGIETVAEMTRRSIDLLREFRAALITAAVTGQIDPAEWRRRGQTDSRLEKIEAEMSI